MGRFATAFIEPTTAEACEGPSSLRRRAANGPRA
jgi:hypothetical protein